MNVESSMAQAVPAGEPMTLRAALVIYVSCVAVALLVFTPAIYVLGWLLQRLGVHSTENVGGPMVLLSMILHLSIGVYLSRKVLRQLVEWHLLATLADVSSSKLTYVVFWPFLYPLLLARLTVAKHL